MKKKILILSSILLFLSCGSRKSSIDKYLQNVAVEEKVKIKVDSTEKLTMKLEQTNQSTIKQNTDVLQKDVKTEIKEVFKDGKLSERTTTTRVSDITDKSQKDLTFINRSEANSFKEVAKLIDQSAKKVVDSLIKSENKNVKAENTIAYNFGGWGVILALGSLVIFFYFIFKK